jgi:hypothetical protein
MKGVGATSAAAVALAATAVVPCMYSNAHAQLSLLHPKVPHNL